MDMPGLYYAATQSKLIYILSIQQIKWKGVQIYSENEIDCLLVNQKKGKEIEVKFSYLKQVKELNPSPFYRLTFLLKTFS